MNDQKPKWWKTLVNVIVQEVGTELKAQNARIAAMEAKMEEFTYKGVWETGTVYRQHNSVTDNGSLWICVSPHSTQRPGDSQDWKLAVKRGKDGRDARP